MARIEMNLYIHFGSPDFDNLQNRFVDEKTGVFVKEIEIPFIPFIGLQISYGKIYTPPITSIVYHADNEVFCCGFEEDLQIPNKAIEIMKALNTDWAPNDFPKYIAWATSNKKKILTDNGWELRGII